MTSAYEKRLIMKAFYKFFKKGHADSAIDASVVVDCVGLIFKRKRILPPHACDVWKEIQRHYIPSERRGYKRNFIEWASFSAKRKYERLAAEDRG